MTGMHLKPEMRIIGIDDSPLLAKDVLVVGAVLRGGGWLDGLRARTSRKTAPMPRSGWRR